MKHKISITPLNCAFGTGPNTFLRMEESEYSADTVRSIFCKSPDVSWFKMKSITATPYIEPTFYDLKIGDVIEVEFSSLCLSGTSPQITIPVIMINNDYTTSTMETIIATETLKSNYKRYKCRYVVPSTFTGIGILLNIRPNGTGHEIIIKDLEVTIDTSNPSFSIVNNIVGYRTKTDYMQCIDYVSGTSLSTAYNGLLTVFNANEILFPDDNTMQFSGTNITNFKGLMACLNGNKYRQSIAVYCEYVTDGTNVITATAYRVSEAGVLTSIATADFPATATTKKKIIYLSSGSTQGRKTFVDLGKISVNNFSIKNVRFSIPQFDEYVKREPNKLEELYTNLRAKLR